MFGEFKMQQRPELAVSLQDNMSSPAAVAAVGPAVRVGTGTHKMSGTCPTVTGCTVNLYIINEI
jgi:hypothetical protein